MSSPARPTIIVTVNALTLGAVVGVGWALVKLARPAWAVAWVIVGLLANQVTLWLMLRGPQSTPRQSLAKTLANLNATLEAQSSAIAAQQRQIETLTLHVNEPPLRRRVHQELADQTPRLAAVVEELTEAEESLPEALMQTRAWVAEARRLAAHTQAYLQALSEEITGR